MTRLMLDTSAYSAFLRGHAGVKRVIQEADELRFSPIVLGELYAGFRRGSRRQENERYLRTFLSSPRASVVDVNEETAHCYAEIVNFLRRRGSPVPANDLWIAASAMQYGLRLLTTDSHFQRIPQVIVDYRDALA